MAAQAAKYELTKSKLQQGIDTILKYIVWILIPVGLLTIVMQYRGGHQDWNSLILAITGALVPMVPEGLILITSTAFALGVIRLGKRNCLVNELPAIEGLARVNVVCADKTGTLTENKLEFRDAYAPRESEDGTKASTPAAGGSEISASAAAQSIAVSERYRQILAQISWSDPDPNMTMLAIRNEFSQPAARDQWHEIARQPFSSANKWSGVSFSLDTDPARAAVENAPALTETGVKHANYIIGAPDVLLKPVAEDHANWLSLVAAYENDGLRVLLLGEVNCAVAQYRAECAVSAGFTPLAVLVFDQTIRPDVEETLAYFNTQNVALKVISGDNLRSVTAVANRLGIDTSHGVDARDLDHEGNSAAFDAQVLAGGVFGRVRPEQKQEMVHALQRGGNTVAMTGDGVNDVLALKDADIGVAMGAGSSASRSVAKIVLLDNKFATLPHVVAEGRRVIGNIERVANLFLTKTTYSAMMAMLVIVAAVPFPFQPIHVTITGWFTIGIPAFILALPPNHRRARDGFVRRVLSFAMPSGVIVGASSFATYLIVSGGRVPQVHVQESTAALAALIITSTWVLACVARPFNWWKWLLIVLPLAGYGIIFNWSFTQQLFLLDSSNSQMMWTAVMIGGIGVVLIELLWRIVRGRLA
ncbi:HAD-IC family P-type ATPase [Arcanobacterium hippocoleae]